MTLIPPGPRNAESGGHLALTSAQFARHIIEREATS